MRSRRFDVSLIHTSAGPTALHLFSAYVFGLWTLKLLFEPLPELAHLPQEMVSPVGILYLFPSSWVQDLMTQSGLWALKSTAVVCAALSMLPRVILFTGPIACIAATVEQSAIRSFGIVSHPEIAPLIAGYVLVLFAWYRWLNVGGSPAKDTGLLYSAPLITIALILTLAYSLVGINRLFFEGGLSIFLSESLPNYILHRTLAPSLFGFEIGENVSDWPLYLTLFIKFGFFSSTIVEITAPICLISKYYRYVFFSVMIPFHVIILFTMNISFFENVLLYVVLLDFSRWLIN